MNNKTIFRQLERLTSERVNRNSMNIDTLDVTGILRLMNGEDQTVPRAVAKEIPFIAKAVGLIVTSLKRGGRLLYVGAGTSGRLGILDATECPPTFGTRPQMIRGIIAGGRRAVFRSQEGAEDRREQARKEIQARRIGPDDVVCGIAASMRTPYVVAALAEAKRRGASTLLVTTNPRRLLRTKMFAGLRRSIDVAICPDVGPEVIMGSTRLKAGTAQKLTLNMLTTAAMIRLGKVYGNRMVDLKMTSRKLEERAKRVIMQTTGVNYGTAGRALSKSGDHVKTAIVMIQAKISAREARIRLLKAGGFVRAALGETSRPAQPMKRKKA